MPVSELHAACVHLGHALEQTDFFHLNVDSVQYALTMLCDETETQGYPRIVALILPYLLMHDKCLQLSQQNPMFQVLISNNALKLLNQGRERPYIFTTLASAVRTASLTHPDAIAILPFEPLVTTIARHPPLLRPEFQLEQIMSQKLRQFGTERTYESYYGKSLSYGLASIYSFLNCLPQISSHTAKTLVIIDGLLTPWLTQPADAPVYHPWKSTTQLHIILILTCHALPNLSVPDATTYEHQFYSALASEKLPRYRFLFEWILLRLYIAHPPLRPSALTRLDQMDLSSPKHCVSLLKISGMLSRLPDTSHAQLLGLANRMNALSACPKTAVRHEAQWQFLALYDHAVCHDISDVTENPALKALADALRRLDAYIRPPAWKMAEAFDPIRDHTVTFLVEGGYMTIEPVIDGKMLRRADFLALHKEDERRNGAAGPFPPQAPLIPLGDPVTTSTQSSPPPDAPRSPKPTVSTTSTTLQIKPTSHPKKYPLALIATLIASPTNLGGITRAAEALGASALYMSKPESVVNSREFKATAVSSQHHIAIETLNREDLRDFMTARRRRGWDVVGVEQTDGGVVLGAPPSPAPSSWSGQTTGRKADATFKAETLLLLGSEREGIPGELLGACDWCVEVPLAGVTRSLNVQTAGAVVMYEYGRQMRGREGER